MLAFTFTFLFKIRSERAFFDFLKLSCLNSGASMARILTVTTVWSGRRTENVSPSSTETTLPSKDSEIAFGFFPLLTVELFSELIKSGLAWSLQGCYGRTAMALISAKVISKKGEIL